MNDENKVYIAEHHAEYYDGGNRLVGVFSDYDVAWEAIHQTIKEQSAKAKPEHGDRTYHVGEFGVIGVTLDKRVWL